MRNTTGPLAGASQSPTSRQAVNTVCGGQRTGVLLGLESKSGQLGNNSTIDASAPVAVRTNLPGPLAGIRSRTSR